jgi:hypothetical protein
MDKIETLNTLFGGNVAVRDGKLTVPNTDSVAGPALDLL